MTTTPLWEKPGARSPPTSHPNPLCGFSQAQQERPVGWEGKQATNSRKGKLRGGEEKEMTGGRKGTDEPRAEGSVQGTGIVK